MEKEKIRLEDDFYESINHEWLKKTKIPVDRSSTGAFYEIHDRNEKALMTETNDLIEAKNKNKNKIKDNVILNYALLAELAKNFDQRERLGVKPLVPILNVILDLNNKDDLLEKYKYLILRGIPLPFEFAIMQDFKNIEDQILAFSGPGLILPDTTYYDENHPAKEKLLEAYKTMSKKLLKFYYSDEEKNNKIIEQALAFDSSLVEFTRSALESADYTKIYNIYDIDSAQQFSQNLNFKKLAEELVNKKPENILKSVDKLNVIYPKFLENIDKIFNDENFENIKSWMFLQTIIHFSGALNEESRIISGEFSRTLSGQEEPMNKEKAAFYLAYSKFNIPFGSYFAKKTFKAVAKKNVEHMVKAMINIYKKRLIVNTWLSQETKLKAIQKLETLGMHVGYPNEIQPFYKKIKISNSDFRRDNLVKNILSINVVKNTWEFEQYQKPINRNYWGMSPAEVNAYYNPFMNHIVFPAGILNKPFYSYNQSEATNYGGIGAVIAHEISHAFDNNGAQFDEKGNLNSWWTDDDFATFKEKAKDMIALFDGKTTEYGKCNGQLTVSENIADAGGISCALEATVSNYKNDIREFFTNWATVWRSIYKPETAKQLLVIDVHAPAKLRANVQLQNLDEFYTAFGIKSTDKMWLPKSKRVKIW
ncbi:M13-type metalloendopeptidase [Mycoplasmopsis primatum]|uniref:M13-type metalloendopeptidase n=1 Tax=Mycoplasmopsis primatum TaxID=55604 RepID=UPI000497158B|nr:M13 family metallopeptidase [Mycoplasmopsis primatum]